ncbi:hypothetical protein VPH35_055127 [Triticum aestivum]
MQIENFKRAWNDAGLRNMGFRHYETSYPNLPKQDGWLDEDPFFLLFLYIHMLSFLYFGACSDCLSFFTLFLCQHFFSENSDACGIFILNWLKNWRSRNALQSVFTQDMVQDARIRFAVDILFSDHNIIDEGKMIVKDL